jgi:hypothetical protein
MHPAHLSMSYCCRMRSRRYLLLAGWLVLATAVEPRAAAPVTIAGELVDVQCQLRDPKNVGPDHADCALSCAKRGAVLGILASDGLYVVTGDFTHQKNRRLIEFVATIVEATGLAGETEGGKLIALTGIRKTPGTRSAERGMRN